MGIQSDSRINYGCTASLWLFSCCVTLSAQVHRVDPQKTITFEVAGATAAYSLDPIPWLRRPLTIAGWVSIAGKQPGTTHICGDHAIGHADLLRFW